MEAGFCNLLTVFLSTSNSGSFSFGVKAYPVSLFDHHMQQGTCLFGARYMKITTSTGVMLSSEVLTV